MHPIAGMGYRGEHRTMSDEAYPLSRYAVVLGKTPRALQLTLNGTPPGKVILVSGQQTKAYYIHQLPVRYVQELDSRAKKQAYRNAEHLLSDPPRRFVPRDCNGDKVSMPELAQHHIDRAVRFRAALAVTIELRDQLSDAECRRRAFNTFRREVNTSEKTWDRWLKRVIRRDAGEERFDDLALYVDKIVTRRSEAREAISIGQTAAERTVLDALACVKNPAKPTLDEVALIWTVACEFIAQGVERGRKVRRVQRRLFNLLANSAVALGRTDEALKKSMKRKFARWIEGGRTFAAIEDQRPMNSGLRAPALPEEDRLKLIGYTTINCGGRESQAYRELRASGQLSTDVTSRFIDNPASKSYVPRRIREAVTPDVKRLEPYHRGPREHKLRGPYHTRDWNVVAAGDWFQADDMTPPAYFYVPGDPRAEMMRGQFLPMVDERTTMILGFVLIPRRNYDSISIRALITDICSEHGLPGRGFSFERGIWQSSKILTGDKSAAGLSDEEMCLGLRRLGMQFRHADLPRGKVIERVIGQLQDMMESLPGYCGRNEILERDERFQRLKSAVETGRADASEHFLTAEQMHCRFAKLVDEYNDTPQGGRKLNGLSPREGWEQLQGREPRPRFNAATHYFLASDVRKLKIGRNGITIVIGKQRFNYKDAGTGERQGETVFAWFNPQRLDLLPCTRDRSGTGVFVVERSYELPAVGASRDQLSSENAKSAAHRSYAANLYYTVKNVLPATAFRGQTLDRKGLQFGEQIESQHKRITARRQSEARLDREIIRKARRANISPLLVPRTQGARDVLDEYADLNAEMDRKLLSEAALL